MGKLTLYPSVVAVLLMPKAAEQHARGQSTTGLVRMSLLAVGLLGGCITVTFFLFPSFIVSTLFGKQYLAKSSLLGFYGLAMTFYSLVNVWLFYFLAIEDHRYGYMLLFGTILLIASLALLGSNLTQVVIILVGIGIILYLSGEALLLVNDGGRL